MIEPADNKQLNNLFPADGDDYFSFNYPLNIIRQIMVSTHESKIIGSITIVINSAADSVVDIAIMSLTEKYRYYFAKDVITFLKFLMQKYRKISCFCLRGNPSEKSYDRLVKSHGWKIVGIMEKQVINKFGEWTDIKHYEFINHNWRSSNGTE